MNRIKNGVWPTMITPYKADGSIDYDACGKLVEMYVESNCAGIFAVCQSSEMFFLTRSERTELARFVVEKAAGRIGVVVSGHISDEPEQQIAELSEMCSTGADAVVLVSNRLDKFGSFEEGLKSITKALPSDMPLGMYECPYPEKHLMTDDEVKMLVDSGRFVFLKDTSCDMEIMKRRAEITKDTGFQLFNANSATIAESMKLGYEGFCGIMANFHPDAYSWLCDNLDDKRAYEVSRLLGVASVIEARCYPICAKKYLDMFGIVHMTDICRSVKPNFVPAIREELDGVRVLTEHIRNIING